MHIIRIINSTQRSCRRDRTESFPFGETYGEKLGDPNNPLLVSVRSGAAASMPGMMDSVLNLGINS